MSWMNDGCYHLGTVEMMNSNNVVCAYLKSQTSFYFDEDNSLEWNNKKWRQLFYVTKEINVSGKPYPYYNEELTKAVLNKITELAKENLGWSYQYGIEEYLDMKSIRGLYDIEKHQRKIAEGNTEKKNIIFHSNVMYNDMLNDNRTQYLCYRNKVNKTKIINYSGKASCLVCGESAVEESDYPDDYNERFWHADRVICDCCYEESKCEWCGKVEGKSKVKFIGKRFSCSNQGKRLCADCYKYYVYKCPCCGDDFFVEDHGTMPNDIPVLRLSEKIYYEDFSQCEYDYNFRYGTLPTKERIENLNSSLIPVFTCRECLINKLMGYGEEEEALFEEVTNITRKNTMYFRSRTYCGIVSSKVYTLDEIFNDEKLSSLIPINLVKSSS